MGKAALPAGILCGLLLIAALFTKGFGLWAGKPPSAPEAPALIKHGETVQIPEGSPLRAQIGVAAARAETVTGKLALPAIVESDPARTDAVLTPLTGRVLDLRVGLGDRVSAGQVLAVIDSPDLAQAYDDYDKAADAARLAARNLRRQEGQFKLGTVSARDLDQARSDNAQAAAELVRTQARLTAVGAPVSLVRGARPLLVRAPTDGSITALSVARGAVINDATQPLMTIADLNVIWVTAQLPEPDIAAVTKDQDADISLDAYPGRVLHGHVLFVSDVLEPDTRRDKVRIALANPDHALKPNMFGTVTLLAPPRARVVLPTASLLMNNDRTTVFVETAPWIFARRQVETQLEEGDTVAIRSGVAAGERVVVRGGILLND
jgi:cobalt-zinc-cadmium efflux system membrane fusion protein